MKTAIETLEKELNKIKKGKESEEHKKAITVLKNYVQALDWQTQ